MAIKVARFIVALVCLASTAVHADADTGELFRRGTEAYSNNNHVKARDYFEAAREQGLDTSALHYNLGVVYYRLEHYDAAERSFRRLQNRPGWRALAHYNLGLIARKRGRPEPARQHFRSAADTGDDKVARLAERALHKLDEPASSGQLYLSLALGHDSNITLSPDRLDNTSHSDEFGEAYILGEHPLGERSRISASAYLRRYQQGSRFDDTGFELQLSRLHQWGPWDTETGGGFSPLFLDGDTYQTRYTVFMEGRRSLFQDQRLRWVADGNWIEGARAFDYLDGWRARLRAYWSRPLGAARLSLGYRFEYHDRADLEDGNDFFSYSPRRNRVQASVSYAPTQDWYVRGGARYEHSRYADPHRIDGETTLRQDHQIDLFLRLMRSLRSGWWLNGQFSHEDQQSTLDTHDYDRDLVRLGLEYQY